MGLIAVGLVGCGKGGGANNTLAIVNKDPITMDQFHKYLETKAVVRVMTGNGQVGNAQVADTLAFQGLQDLIQQRLVMQMAADESVLPTDAELAAEVEFQKKRNPQFLKVLTGQGMTLDDIRERLRVDLARERLITNKIKVTKEDAQKYIKDNPKEFTDPASADALVIFVRTDADRAKVDAELARGQSFQTVASRMSQMEGARTNPEYREKLMDNMPGPIKAAISKANASESTEWVRLSDGWAKFFVRQKIAAKAMVMDEIKTEVVRRQMALDKGLKARDIDKTLLEKYKAAAVEIKYEPLKPPYEDFAKKLKEATSGDTNSPDAKPAEAAKPAAEQK